MRDVRRARSLEVCPRLFSRKFILKLLRHRRSKRKENTYASVCTPKRVKAVKPHAGRVGSAIRLGPRNISSDTRLAARKMLPGPLGLQISESDRKLSSFQSSDSRMHISPAVGGSESPSDQKLPGQHSDRAGDSCKGRPSAATTEGGINAPDRELQKSDLPADSDKLRHRYESNAQNP
ncbi:hypothetical protein EVAR_90813_1 [Eumeta japonica]|uniref:Uncharacterized protein n=1 Tax=Eumeta variegata TaxID=151549 RepID=A0A4C2A2I6_EUMVA|nr:hypothetical protein EVAR_90813_1 [Eumeta japonica]